MSFYRNEDDPENNDASERGPDSSEPRRVVPLLPLRDIVVFPHMVVPLFVGRPKSIQALEQAASGSRELLLCAQRKAGDDDPGEGDIFELGTLGSIVQLLRLPDGTVKVLVEGKKRARLHSFVSVDPFFACEIEELPDDDPQTVEAQALVRSIHTTFETYVKLNKKVPDEVVSSIQAIQEPGKLADTIVAHLNLKLDERQELLEVTDHTKRLEEVFGRMQGRDRGARGRAQDPRGA